MAASKAIKIDGSTMEGGGQILRMSVALSALLGKPILIHDIRGKRSKPGLKAQHLTGIQLVRDLVGASLSGDRLNSSSIEFASHASSCVRAGKYSADTGTAGATTLLAQVSLPCLVFAGGRTAVTLRGGTNADMAPQIEYFTEVFRPALRRFGAEFKCEVVRKGYFPRGGGQVEVVVENPVRHLNPVTMLDRGEVKSIKISASVAGKLPVAVAEEMAAAAKKRLKRATSLLIETHCFKESQAVGNGSSIVITAETSSGCVLGGSAVGNPKTKASQTGAEAAEELSACLGADWCVDTWLQDQLVVYMALARGRSAVRTGPLTLHTQTAIHIAEILSGAKFNVKEEKRDGVHSWVIECDGMGLEREAG